MEDFVNRFREQLSKAIELTDKPFAANIPVGWGRQRAITDRLVDVAIEEKLRRVSKTMTLSADSKVHIRW